MFGSIRTALGLLALIVMTGCSSIKAPVVNNPTPIDEVERQAQIADQQVYKIAPGTELDVKFYYTPELNESVIVRPDGKISLQLIQDVAAAGLSPEELANTLEQRYARELKTPEIAVIVASANQKVYIDGQVAKPGILELEGPVTILQAVAFAGGFTDEARRDSIVLIRRRLPQEPLVIPINVSAIVSGSDLRQDLMLANYDIVHVPKSPIANVNQWVDQYIRRNIPSPFLSFIQ